MHLSLNSCLWPLIRKVIVQRWLRAWKEAHNNGLVTCQGNNWRYSAVHRLPLETNLVSHFDKWLRKHCWGCNPSNLKIGGRTRNRCLFILAIYWWIFFDKHLVPIALWISSPLCSMMLFNPLRKGRGDPTCVVMNLSCLATIHILYHQLSSE